MYLVATLPWFSVGCVEQDPLAVNIAEKRVVISGNLVHVSRRVDWGEKCEFIAQTTAFAIHSREGE